MSGSRRTQQEGMMDQQQRIWKDFAALAVMFFVQEVLARTPVVRFTEKVGYTLSGSGGRNIYHMLEGVCGFMYLVGAFSDWGMQAVVWFFFVAGTLINAVRLTVEHVIIVSPHLRETPRAQAYMAWTEPLYRKLRSIGAMRESEVGKPDTAITYSGTALILFYTIGPLATAFALLPLAFGDPAANRAGKRFGRFRISWNGKSLVAGWCGFVVVTHGVLALCLMLRGEPLAVIVAAGHLVGVLVAATLETLWPKQMPWPSPRWWPSWLHVWHFENPAIMLGYVLGVWLSTLVAG